MELMVRSASWNRRKRFMNRQGTVWNRPEPKQEPERSNQVPNASYIQLDSLELRIIFLNKEITTNYTQLPNYRIYTKDYILVKNIS